MEMVANEFIYEIICTKIYNGCQAVIESFEELNNFFNIDDTREKQLKKLLENKNKIQRAQVSKTIINSGKVTLKDTSKHVKRQKKKVKESPNE